MRHFVFLALCGSLTAVVAQTASGSSSTAGSSASNTETSPLLFSTNGDGDSTDFSVAVAGSSGSTTTYLVSCAEAGSINCNFDTATIVGGPSTVAMYYDYDDTVTYSLGCNIHGSSAACVKSEGGSGFDGTSFLSSFTVPASEVALGFITDATATATATAGATAGATSTATGQATPTTAASTGSSPTSATVKSTAASSGGTTSSTGSATGTGSAASQTETQKGAAISRFNGAIGSWVAVGSVVAALGLIF